MLPWQVSFPSWLAPFAYNSSVQCTLNNLFRRGPPFFLSLQPGTPCDERGRRPFLSRANQRGWFPIQVLFCFPKSAPKRRTKPPFPSLPRLSQQAWVGLLPILSFLFFPPPPHFYLNFFGRVRQPQSHSPLNTKEYRPLPALSPTTLTSPFFCVSFFP